MESPQTRSWSESAKEYDAFEKKWHHYATVASELVGKMQLEPGFRVLELACGTGACTSILARLCSGGKVTALDFSEGMIEAARENIGNAGLTNVRFVHGDAGSVADILRGESFDAAVCNSAFWQFQDGERVLRGLRLLLTQPGLFGVSLPFWRADSSPRWAERRAKIKELFLKYGVDPESFGQRFEGMERRRRDIPALLRSLGFAIVKDETFQFSFPAGAREQWRSIPVFSGLLPRTDPLLSDLEPPVAAKLREELSQWRKQNRPLEEPVSSWRILVASKEVTSG